MKNVFDKFYKERDEMMKKRGIELVIKAVKMLKKEEKIETIKKETGLTEEEIEELKSLLKS
ncbi:hypothetical protein U8V72_14460 [Priestia filamentosa]|uniref:hypothetical protein n=1 Tax=Priestia filamentosa TaxID=1402861 RepID=UPI0005894D42